MTEQGRLMHALVAGFLRERERDLEAMASEDAVSTDARQTSATYAQLVHWRNIGKSFQKLHVITEDGRVVVDTDQLGLGMTQVGWETFAKRKILITYDGLGISQAQ